MTLEQLLAALRDKSGQIAALKTKAFAPEATEEDVAALEKLLKEIDGLEKQIELLKAAEAVEARAVVPASMPVTNTAPAVPAVPKSADVDPVKVLSLTGAAVMKGRTTGVHPLKVLENEGYGQLSQALVADPKAKAVNTLVSSEGGILVPAAQVGGNILPLLRPASTFLQAGPTRIPMVNGQFKQARGASGPTASYVGEAGLKPISTPTFDAIDMSSKKLAGIVPITREAIMWTVGDIEAWVRNELQSAMAQTMDLNAWLGTGSGSSPTGILNKAGVQTYTPVFAAAAAPTLQELDALATGMVSKLIAENMTMTGSWRWVMSYRTALKLSSFRLGTDADSELAFPEMEGFLQGQARWKGFPVVISAHIPTNGGGTTDETTIALIDFNHVLFGEEEGIRMSYSEQATLNTTGATDGTGLVHLWQQNMVAVLAESMHDFGLRRAKAVVKATIRF